MSLLEQMTSDIDTDKATMVELQDWYNKNSGSRKVVEFKTRPEAEEKVKELKAAITELAGGGSKKVTKKVAVREAKKAEKAAKKSAKAPAAKKDGKKAAKSSTEKKAPGGKSSSLKGKYIHKLVKENPRRPNTIAGKTWETFRSGTKYEDILAAGGRGKDVAWDIKHGYLKASDSRTA
jgi:hypothetical protein